MIEKLESSLFPRLDPPVGAKWAPLLLRPILGSPEQLVIAVAVVNKNGFHVERANSLDRLVCLFGDVSPSVVLVAEAAIDALTEDLANRGSVALTDFAPIFEGTGLGEIREGQGRSLQQLAASWLAGLSSLHASPELAPEVVEAGIEAGLDEVPALGLARDRLPTLVLDYVADKRPGLKIYFNEDIRENVRRRRRRKVQDVFIDYAGSKLVANFGTFLPTQHATSVDYIKRRLWDLEVSRDREAGTMSYRGYEMIVQRPGERDPQISQKQFDRIQDALAALNEQARTEDLLLRPMTSVEEIGDHLLQAEAA